MQDKSLKKLEYDKIVAKLAAHCGFAVSREQAEALLPAADSCQAAQLLAETDEARELLRLHPLYSPGGLWDVRPWLRHIQIGGVLEPEQLVNIAALCRSARLSKAFFSELKGSFPLLTGLGRSLAVIKTVESAVEKAIGPDMTIQDQASERLAGIRRKQRDKAERIKERLDSLIRNQHTARFLQEPIVTMREGRFVVPVKQEHRGQIAGVAHDMSSSGATVFIEPLAVMELNNDLAKLRHEEEEEIAAILRALCLVVGNFAAEIAADLALLARLDFILAKGRLSHELDGAAPRINDNGFIRLIRARHPLIAAERVVAVDLQINRDIAALVITGPNTGGKTVTLKTIGLLTCMGLAGLHIPAEPGSEIACFKQVMADIGDEQSIEQSLSTFSSHMSNIVEILAAADSRSLLLFDELGAGTDPAEGAALAMSILKYVQAKGAKTVATTHYSELKAFAYNNPGFLNASMEFDLETLSPTFRLLMGMPGSSNAFEISRRLGLSEEIIAAAAASLSSEDTAVAAMLANLEDMRRSLSEQQQQAERLAAAGAARERSLKQQERELKAQQAEILRKAHLEAQGIIDQTLAQSRGLYEQEKRLLQEKQSAERVWQQSQKQLKHWRVQLEEEIPEPVFSGEAPKSVSIGDYMFLPKLNQYGSVLSLPDSGGEVLLQVGVLKLKAKLGELRPAEPEQARPGKRQGAPRRGGHGGLSGSGDWLLRKTAAVQAELDLHGLDTLEALPVLDKYIDDAFLAGLKQVQINHGRGTGALRAFVHRHLRQHRLVKSFRDGNYHEGGIGVTIVDLNQ